MTLVVTVCLISSCDWWMSDYIIRQTFLKLTMMLFPLTVTFVVYNIWCKIRQRNCLITKFAQTLTPSISAIWLDLILYIKIYTDYMTFTWWRKKSRLKRWKSLVGSFDHPSNHVEHHSNHSEPVEPLRNCVDDFCTGKPHSHLLFLLFLFYL